MSLLIKRIKVVRPEAGLRAMPTTAVIHQTACRICEVSYQLAESGCDRCGQTALAVSGAERTAIDLDLDQPVILYIKVSVHYCAACQHYFRVQPPFMRRDAIYTNRVVAKAVASVYEDGMAMRRVADRLARDFWVQPSEGMIRRWCRTYSQQFDFERDYQPWVVSQFSGILCVDEVYQGQLALLLAVDPAAAEGDRWVGYQLMGESVAAPEVETFLLGLKTAGIEPEQVITDGSSLYPTVLSKVWPQAAHQLCLFHETRRVTAGVMKLIQSVRQSLPPMPPPPTPRGTSRMGAQPPSDDPADPTVQRWQLRQAQRQKQIAWVHQLAEQGLSQRAIQRQTGFHRQTIRKWLRLDRPDLALAENPDDLTTPIPAPPSPSTLKRAKMVQVQALADQGLSYSEIGRQVGIHRVTVKIWLQQPRPSLPPLPDQPTLVEPPTLDPPPYPWTTWTQVSTVREALKEHRFLVLRRPEKLSDEEQDLLSLLLTSPIGPTLKLGRDFLVDWYRLWTDDAGQRRPLDQAQADYETWRSAAHYAAEPHLHSIQVRFTPAKFEKLSQFLRQPDWEATNNGAERAGRAFRHDQAPHFNLRTQETIDQALTVAACLHQQAVTAPPKPPLHTCQRGRTPHPEPVPA